MAHAIEAHSFSAGIGALDDSRYTLDHIEAKLARLPHGMQTEAGRRLGEQRLAWLRDFRAAFSAQWGGGQLR
ncbi:metal dependent phosphohydrolase [Bordetella pertussis]|nr:metal dependent phosphohydrolase [Bordetella pertussis]